MDEVSVLLASSLLPLAIMGSNSVIGIEVAVRAERATAAPQKEETACNYSG